MRRSLWAIFVISLTLTNCYEPLGDSVLVTNRAELKGVCQDASSVEVRLLKNGDFKYRALEGGPQAYEAYETLCDGVDNDCDGVIDESEDAPLAMKPVGVCAERRPRCDGAGGWLEPDYTQVEGYGAEQCDGLDNDCDGNTDETLSDAPLADLQDGVCAESVRACVGGDWVEPKYELISMFSTNDSPCDQLDNDCDGRLDEGTVAPELCDGVDNDSDGSTDEEWDRAAAPLADLRAGVCAGSKRVCEMGVGWVEPMYSEIAGYGSEASCNGYDNDCDGSTDEDINPVDAPLTQNQVGVCEGALQSCVSGGWVSDYSRVPDYEEGVERSLSDGLDNNCNGDVDEVLPPCAPNCPDLDFVRIEGGSFMMGSEEKSVEQPVHNVNVPTFEMMRTEITVAQYRACVNASVCSPLQRGTGYTWSSVPYELEDHPINGVAWFQLMEFAAWVGARLPTEAEWEYAASSRTGATYPWGESSPNCSLANYEGCEGSTSRVCSRSEGNTSQGLCDMAGNVWEWVQDEWKYDYNGAPIDGSGWCAGGCPENANDSNYDGNPDGLIFRVVRGGSRYSMASGIRTAIRLDILESFNQHDDVGGRLARSVR